MEKFSLTFSSNIRGEKNGQYTDWDHIENGYLNQKMIGDVVGGKMNY